MAGDGQVMEVWQVMEGRAGNGQVMVVWQVMEVR